MHCLAPGPLAPAAPRPARQQQHAAATSAARGSTGLIQGHCSGLLPRSCCSRPLACQRPSGALGRRQLRPAAAAAGGGADSPQEQPQASGRQASSSAGGAADRKSQEAGPLPGWLATGAKALGAVAFIAVASLAGPTRAAHAQDRCVRHVCATHGACASITMGTRRESALCDCHMHARMRPALCSRAAPRPDVNAAPCPPMSSSIPPDAPEPCIEGMANLCMAGRTQGGNTAHHSKWLTRVMTQAEAWEAGWPGPMPPPTTIRPSCPALLRSPPFPFPPPSCYPLPSAPHYCLPSPLSVPL